MSAPSPKKVMQRFDRKGFLTESEFNVLRDRVSDLERENARLREALEPLAKIPVEEFGKQDTPNQPLMGWNYHTIYVRDVLAARAALKGE